MRNYLINLALTAVCLASLSACDRSAQQEIQTNEQNFLTKTTTKIVVRDFTDSTITLTKPAERIVALAPHIVENLYSIGAGNKIVGVVQHSNFPNDATKHSIVGGYEKINYEKIVALKPDLIVAWESGNSYNNINTLKELGFTVLIDQPDSLDDIAKSLKMLGAATGNTTQSNAIAKSFIDNLNSLRAHYADKATVSTFYQVWNDPLITINGNHIISDTIRACGGRNVFATEFATAPRTNIESVISRNPEAIIASGMGEARPEWLDEWTKWDNITAVRRNNLFYVNPDHLQRHTIRQLLAIESICAQLDEARQRQN